MARTAEIHRVTKETDIYVQLEIDGSGKADIIVQPCPPAIKRWGAFYCRSPERTKPSVATGG